MMEVCMAIADKAAEFKRQLLKASPSVTPFLERESFAEITGLIIQRLDVLSIQKSDCEQKVLKITYSNLR